MTKGKIPKSVGFSFQGKETDKTRLTKLISNDILFGWGFHHSIVQ